MEKNGTIMIVDDNEDVRNMYKDFLYCFAPDLEVIQARNGREAADKLKELSQTCSLPYAVLTDFNMPVMNGLELLKFIRNHFIKMRVVMISGDVTQKLQISVTKLDCQLFSKPADMEKVCLTLLEEAEDDFVCYGRLGIF